MGRARIARRCAIFITRILYIRTYLSVYYNVARADSYQHSTHVYLRARYVTPAAAERKTVIERLIRPRERGSTCKLILYSGCDDVYIWTYFCAALRCGVCTTVAVFSLSSRRGVACEYLPRCEGCVLPCFF